MTADSQWTRREFLSVAAVGAVGAVARVRVLPNADRLAYIGTYTNDGRSEGIYRLLLNTDTGTLRLDGVAAKSSNPSYLAIHPNGRVLYAVNELAEFQGKPTGGVSAFAIGARDRLTLLNQQESQGKAPCYVSVDREGRFVFVANYTGGSIASIPVRQDGGLAVARTVVNHKGTGPDPVRQASPHAHCILPDPSGRYVLAVDLGIDAVLTYTLDEKTGAITVSDTGAATRPGAGPRHLTFHPNGRFAYLANELDSTLSVFTYDAGRGALEEIDVTAAAPGGTVQGNHPADIHVSPSGRHVYISNRGEDNIAVFAIDAATGKVTLVEQVLTGGKSPRNFTLDPNGRWLLAANQRSDSIVSFKVDPESGRLTPTGHQVELATPVCIKFR
jgi:6-phosphogluconolactonase